MTTFQSVNFISTKQKLIGGLKRIVATSLALPLVPIGNNKQPLGARWQQRPFTATKLIEAIEGGGVKIPIQGKTKKIQPLGFGLITGRSLTIEGNKSLGQFQAKKGNNEGLECLLKMWDGSGSFVDRVNAETDSKGLASKKSFQF